ncbi:DUF2255 family protein [Bosea sp. 47.2.35]|jgi:hypothetical protein|uniref:DUF2255 family protein n=1 Tax=Bosea sp. 47.2.35 TaxID=2969304 RepID=UPI0021502411|nr:DUF2255 family protein [Bosea sp. 47.2.35]MCR4524201.1 DUF2255 family protein [Bosea sp. 47.2.35]
MPWTKDELGNIAKADDLRIAPFREDGMTPGTPTWIWSVVIEDGLFVRAYHGVDSRWYKAAVREKSGQISVAKTSYEVSFEQAETRLKDRIDEAYRTKYSGSPYLASMIGDQARAATICIRRR